MSFEDLHGPTEKGPRDHIASPSQCCLQWTAGGRAAHLALQNFVLDRLSAFDIDRAKTDRASTSRLSPHIHMGEISVRHIYFVVCPSPHLSSHKLLNVLPAARAAAFLQLLGRPGTYKREAGAVTPPAIGEARSALYHCRLQQLADSPCSAPCTLPTDENHVV